jgi:hypothetical protein
MRWLVSQDITLCNIEKTLHRFFLLCGAVFASMYEGNGNNIHFTTRINGGFIMFTKLFSKIIVTMLVVTMMIPTQSIFGMTDQAPVAQQVAQPVEQSVEQQLEDLASLTPADLLDLSKLFDCINLFQILNPEVSPAPAPEREVTNHLVTEEELVTDEEVLTDLADATPSDEQNPTKRSKRAIETVADVASLGHSIYEYNKNPTKINAVFMAWDAVATVVPFVPGSYVAKGAIKNDKVQDALGKIKEYVGEDAKLTINKSGEHVLLSKDETKRIRFDLKNPKPHENGHGHVEEKKPNSRNWWKSGPIYPSDVKPK